MGTLFSYSLYSSILLSLLYLSYKWVLAGENQHSFNRVTLWAIYIVSLLALPVTSAVGGLSASGPVAVPDIEVGEIMMTVIDDSEADIPVGQPLYLTLLLWFYAAGIVLALGHTVWIAVKLSRIISRGERVEHGPYRIIITDDGEGIAPFSWCRYVVMSRSDYEESREMILVHELQHLGLHHWVDLLVAQLVGIFQWYNPAAWLMREELKTVHEYQADRAVISSGVGVRDYQMLLIKKAVGARFPSLANSLNHSKLKKRITMMYNQNNSAFGRLRAVALVPVLGIAVAVTNLDAVASVLSDTASAVFVESAEELQTGADIIANPAIPGNDNELDEISVVAYKNTENSSDRQMSAPAEDAGMVSASADDVKAPAGDAADSEKVFSVTETNPEFPGGETELMKFIEMNIRYPEEAFKNNVQGRVIARFVIRKDGSIGDVKIVRSVSPEIDTEAERVIKSLPAFTPAAIDGKPVAVWYTIPLYFKLKGNDSTPAKSEVAHEADDAVFTVVEKKPEFPGGDVELMKYIGSHIKYPAEAIKNNVQGRVVAKFVVRKDGSIGDVEIIRSMSPELDAEAERVIKSFPAFTPGSMNGKPVAVWYTIPVTFKLTGKASAGESKTSAWKNIEIVGSKSVKKDGMTDRVVLKGENYNLPSDSVKIMTDGKEYAGNLDDIDPATIKSVTVKKGQGKGALILVETKQ